MVDMDNQFREPQTSAQEIEQRMRTSLEAAVVAVTGEATHNALEVFPDPATKERREDVDFGVELAEESETAFRAAVAELGVGRETNRAPEALGLSDGYVAFLEGGQAHKMMAELNVVAVSDVAPSVVIISGDAERNIPDKERTVTSGVLAIEEAEVGTTEAEVAEQVLRAHPEFVEASEQVLPYGYTIDGQLTSEATGQFRQIGTVGDAPAVVMKIDREWYVDEAGERKFKRPDELTKMKIIAQLDNVREIGFVTSSTYQPSREIDAIRAANELDIPIKVPTYGTAELARVKGEDDPQPPALNQLAAEAHKTAKQLASLEA